jgi:hypothetical protein
MSAISNRSRLPVFGDPDAWDRKSATGLAKSLLGEERTGGALCDSRSLTSDVENISMSATLVGQQ